MIKVIEKVTTKREFADLCNKYNLPCIPQPTILFTRIAEILYQTNENARYAVCDCDAKIEIVDYKEEKELITYCKKNKFDLVAIVNKDGSGKVGKPDQF